MIATCAKRLLATPDSLQCDGKRSNHWVCDVQTINYRKLPTFPSYILYTSEWAKSGLWGPLQRVKATIDGFSSISRSEPKLHVWAHSKRVHATIDRSGHDSRSGHQSRSGFYSAELRPPDVHIHSKKYNYCIRLYLQIESEIRSTDPLLEKRHKYTNIH